MFNLTANILKEISGNKISGLAAEKAAGLLNEICPKYKIDTADIFHEFIANVLHESNCFTVMEESLHYKAARLMAVWPSRFPNLNIANKYAGNPEALANFVYGNRMGNFKKGDGWLFRGSGPIQITGRENVTNFCKYYVSKFGTIVTPEEMAVELRKNLVVGIHSACWIFAISKNLIQLAIADNIREISKRINGGYIGIQERLKYFEKAKQLITDQ